MPGSVAEYLWGAANGSPERRPARCAGKEPCLGRRGQPVRGQGRSVLCALGGDLAWAHVGPAKA